MFRFYWVGRLDEVKMGNQWRRARELSSAFRDLTDSAERTGDESFYFAIADAAEDVGLPILARVIRQRMVKLVRRPKRPFGCRVRRQMR